MMIGRLVPINDKGLTSTVLIESLKGDLSKKMDLDVEIRKLGQVDLLEQRINGKIFLLQDHIKGFILSFLSSDVAWIRIQDSLHKIDDIFDQYDHYKILQKKPDHINEELKSIKCGSLARRKQLACLSDNIRKLVGFNNEYGSIDVFIKSQPPNIIAQILEDNMAEVGFALASEYLKNVGVDIIKPDRHINNFFSSLRLGLCDNKNPKPDQIYLKAKQIVKEVNTSMIYLDNIIWLHCAKGFGETCTKYPDCDRCSLRRYCNYGS